MKRKKLLLALLSLLLTSCNHNVNLITNLKYNEYNLSLEVFDENKLLKEKRTSLDDELGIKCVTLYNNLLESDTNKTLIDRDGFTGLNYYYCSFKGEYNASLLIYKDNNYDVIVNAYTYDYKWHQYSISNINNELKEEIDEIVPILKDKLSKVEWEDSHNYC